MGAIIIYFFHLQLSGFGYFIEMQHITVKYSIKRFDLNAAVGHNTTIKRCYHTLG